MASFSSKLANINVSRSDASKPLLLRCKVVIFEGLYQVYLELKEIQMGSHVLNLLFAQKLTNINVSRYAVPKRALVPASRYNCDVNQANVNVCGKFQ